ncbi:hypothetical protein N7456_011443 [Penicillium angulare]|uniref:Major facilitator superfamily (MFS) profile domain-containing protein n=1 Tax=Penicillium angulare TaxID=116970 RepID=A0A9W9K0P4_9EURO|nr:hypothetical protein N7456_011443 [Penicillium angulare]
MTVAVPVGAPLGGALTSWVGWRWGFLFQVPMTLICLIVASLRLKAPKSKSESEHEHETLVSARADLNVRGIFLLGLSVMSLMTICQFIGEISSQSNIWLPMLATLFFASVLLYGINERCWTNAPLAPLELLKTNGIGAIYLTQLFLFFSYGGVEYWIRTEDFGNSLASATIMPVVFGNVVGGIVGSRTVQRYAVPSLHNMR